MAIINRDTARSSSGASALTSSNGNTEPQPARTLRIPVLIPDLVVTFAAPPAAYGRALAFSWSRTTPTLRRV